MSNIFKIKRGSSIPTSSNLANGELGYCSGNNKLYIGTSSKPIIPDNSNGKYLSLSGGTLMGDILFSNSNSTQATQPNLKWKTWGENSNTPYIGFATNQSDGTFVWSLRGTTYETGLAIEGSSGNLLWKGVKIATTSDIPTSLKNPNSLIIQGNGTTLINGIYDGSEEKTINITPSSIGAASTDISSLTSGTLEIIRGGTGITSNPSMLINLGSTSAASVFATSPRPGVTGTLSITHGGTGTTSRYTEGTLSVYSSNISISSKAVRSYAYLDMTWVNMNVTLKTSCAADSELQIATISPVPGYDTALAVNTPDDTYVYDISARATSSGKIMISNSGSASIPSGKAMRISGFYITR